ncbi:hypothetical protein ACTXT7_007343 [Hymenolepis weldensis]
MIFEAKVVAILPTQMDDDLEDSPKYKEIVLMANVKTVGQKAIKDDRFLMMTCTIAAAVNIISRFFWGLVSDKLSFKVND